MDDLFELVCLVRLTTIEESSEMNGMTEQQTIGARLEDLVLSRQEKMDITEMAVVVEEGFLGKVLGSEATLKKEENVVNTAADSKCAEMTEHLDVPVLAGNKLVVMMIFRAQICVKKENLEIVVFVREQPKASLKGAARDLNVEMTGHLVRNGNLAMAIAMEDGNTEETAMDRVVSMASGQIASATTLAPIEIGTAMVAPEMVMHLGMTADRMTEVLARGMKDVKIPIEVTAHETTGVKIQIGAAMALGDQTIEVIGQSVKSNRVATSQKILLKNASDLFCSRAPNL